MAATGADFVMIDTEHVPLNRTELANMCAAYQTHGVPPIVRIPSPSGRVVEAARMVIHGGAQGVILPYTETVDEVKQLVGAVKLAPLKGVKLNEALEGNIDPVTKKYCYEKNKDKIVVVNIESVPAMENLDDILKVEGLDAVLIGPHDLTTSLGVPQEWSHPKFLEAVRTIFQKANAAGIAAGIHHACTNGLYEQAQGEQWLEMGCNFFVHSVDMHLVRLKLQQDFAHFKAVAGVETKAPAGDSGGQGV